MRSLMSLILGLGLFMPAALEAQITIENPKEYEGMGVTEHLGDTISGEWQFIDDRGRRVASGVFFYKFEAGSLTFVKKMILLK